MDLHDLNIPPSVHLEQYDAIEANTVEMDLTSPLR